MGTHPPNQPTNWINPGQKFCSGCGVAHPIGDFAVQSNPNGSLRLKSRCNRSLAEQKALRSTQDVLIRINTVDAPMAAAVRLLKENPVALAELIQRNRLLYMALLKEERNKLLARHQRRNNKKEAVKTV